MAKATIIDEIPEGREIGGFLNNVKVLLKMTDKKIAVFVQDEPEVVKGLTKMEDKEIPLNILYQIYWFANINWIESCAKLDNKVENVKNTRGLRDACDREIKRRLKF